MLIFDQVKMAVVELVGTRTIIIITIARPTVTSITKLAEPQNVMTEINSVHIKRTLFSKYIFLFQYFSKYYNILRAFEKLFKTYHYPSRRISLSHTHFFYIKHYINKLILEIRICRTVKPPKNITNKQKQCSSF